MRRSRRFSPAASAWPDHPPGAQRSTVATTSIWATRATSPTAALSKIRIVVSFSLTKREPFRPRNACLEERALFSTAKIDNIDALSALVRTNPPPLAPRRRRRYGSRKGAKARRGAKGARHGRGRGGGDRH